jgi:hypothetical protein
LLATKRPLSKIPTMPAHIIYRHSLILLSLIIRSAAAEPITIFVNCRQPGAEISERTLGLSYETSLLLQDEKGVHYFRPANKPLVAVFKTLGIKCLRIGGNSVDAPSIPIPTEADVSALFEFARAAGVKVIYSVRLQDGDPQSAAKFAKQIHDHFADTLDCFAIGNEPGYYKDYDFYRTKWAAIRDAMAAVFPKARFCGPDQNPSPDLCKKMVRDFASAGLVQITQHSYPFGCAYKNPKERDVTRLIPMDAAASREKMLAPDAYGTYEKILKGMTEAVAGTSVSFRLSEVNSYWFSGLKGASDSYASALWGLDYLYWWAAHGADGLNFHTGDRTGGAVALPCRYAAFASSSHGYEVRPLGYGMKMFDLGGRGKQIPVSVPPESAQALVAYGALTNDKTVLITIINKTHGVGATNLDIQLGLDPPLAASEARVIYLTARNGDLAADSSEVTLGGAPMREDGSWQGHWTPLSVFANDPHGIIVTMPPASAAVIKMHVHE